MGPVGEHAAHFLRAGFGGRGVSATGESIEDSTSIELAFGSLPRDPGGGGIGEYALRTRRGIG